MQIYKSLCVAVTICSTLINIQTHTHRHAHTHAQTASWPAYIKSSAASWANNGKVQRLA